MWVKIWQILSFHQRIVLPATIDTFVPSMGKLTRMTGNCICSRIVSFKFRVYTVRIQLYIYILIYIYIYYINIIHIYIYVLYLYIIHVLYILFIYIYICYPPRKIGVSDWFADGSHMDATEKSVFQTGLQMEARWMPQVTFFCR